MNPDPKRKPYRNKKILAACRDEPCLVNLPGCTRGGADSVAAHLNLSEYGKGKGQKADDCFVAIACSSCHDILDGRKPPPWSDVYCGTVESEILWYHTRGVLRTIRRMIDKGVIS